jgi:hypothetical protein
MPPMNVRLHAGRRQRVVQLRTGAVHDDRKQLQARQYADRIHERIQIRTFEHGTARLEHGESIFLVQVVQLGLIKT